MKVKSRMSCPIRRKDGTWTTVIREFEEDIPDLGELRLNLGSYFLCKGENYACQRSDKSGYSGCS